VADLETTASQAVERVERLAADLALADEALDQADAEGERLQGQVAAAATELERAGQALAARVAADVESLASEAEKAGGLLNALGSEIDAGTALLQDARGAFGDALAGAGETLAAAQAEQQAALGRLESLIESVRQRVDALEAQLDQVAAEVESFLGEELSQALDAVGARIEEAKAQAETATDQAVERIRGEGADFAAAVAELKSTLETAFEQAPETVKAAAAEATAAWLEAHRGLVASLAEDGARVVEMLQIAQGAVEESGLEEIAAQAAADSKAVLDGLQRIVSLYRAATEHCAEYEVDGARQALAQLPA
jgi:predicted  nucleic acid-binding Zn-ribbon protein